MIDAQFPAHLSTLFLPKRIKVLYGGRGAGRSWGCARALLLLGTKSPERILCAREFQNSIADSVHQLLRDQIIALGLSEFYDIQRDRILGKNGTVFSFEGIKNNTTRVKSYEGVTRCWVEEADKVSKHSWGILLPTIRRPGSEVWLTFNPGLETDYTYDRWVKDPELKPAPIRDPADGHLLDGIQESPLTYVVKMTWRDNPWFPQVLRDELESDKRRDYDYYLNVWEGHCLQQLEGAVYAKELRKAQESGRICTVPYDRETPVDCFWDLGRRDLTAIWFVQRVAMQWRILDYYEERLEDITHFIKECQSRGYAYGTMFLPHDARAKRLGYPHSIEQILSKFFTVRIVPKLSIHDGINAVRLIFPNCYFDEKKCTDGLNALRHYRYKIVDGQYSQEPVHDEASHGSDAFRYFAVGAKLPRDDVGGRLLPKMKRVVSEFVEKAPGLGWMQ